MSEIIHNRQTLLNYYSRIAGKIANARRPKWFVKFIIRTFTKKYRINIDDYVIPPDGFKTFNDFFTRYIKPELRRINPGIISPSDGNVYDFGAVTKENKIFVKHKYFSISELIKKQNTNYKSFAVFYLSPANYHRVHAPFDMKITQILNIPGTLKSVREKTIKKTQELYCKNERIVINGESEYGKFSLILVGALMVGKTKLSFDPDIQTNNRKASPNIFAYETPLKITKGEEVGYFEFGSTVILLLEDDCLENIDFEIGQKIQFGETVYN